LRTRTSKIRNRSIHRNTSNRKTEHRQSHLRDVAEDPNLVPIVTGGFRAFWLLINIYHITSGTTLQNGVRERVVSKDCTLMYHPVWRFTCIQYPVIFFQITGLGFSFLVFKSLLSSLLVFSPFWGSRHFLNSVTCNQRARTGTHDYFPQWNVDPQRIFWCLELSDSIDNQSSFHSLAVFRLYFFSIFTGVSFWIFLRFFTVFQKLRLVYAC